MAYKEKGGWHDIRSHNINAYLAEITGGEFATSGPVEEAVLILLRDPQAGRRRRAA